MKQGKFILSLDFELFWGFGGFDKHYLNGYKNNIQNALTALDKILKLCAEFDIKVTIAYVGAMKLDSRQEFLDNYESPSYSNLSLSSHNLISKYCDIIDNNLLFCKDTIEKLRHNKLVELASHTFSHYYCLESGQTSEEFSQDLEYGYNLNGQMNSIIFPRNQVSDEYLKICEKYGFTHYRGFVQDWLWKPEASASRYSFKGILRLLDTYFPITGNRTYKTPTQSGGIVNVPGSIFLRPYNPVLSFLEPLKMQRIISSMKTAARKGECFHLWWHPHNFGANMDRNLKQLELICRKYKELNLRYNYISVFMKDI